MRAPVQTSAIEDKPVDFGDLLAQILARRWWILGITIAFTAIATGVAFLTTPIYRAAVVLAPASVERDSGGALGGLAASSLGGLASGLGLGPKDLDTEEALAVLRSREFTERFVDSLNLMPKLFPRQWDSATGTWKAGLSKVPTPARAYKLFDKKIRSVVEDKKTGLVVVEVDWVDRMDAAVWANDLVRQLNKEMRSRAITKADASKAYLEKELETTSTIEIRAAISRLIESQVKQRMLASVTQDYSFRVVDRAIAPDSDDPLWPTKWLVILVGALLGLGLGIVFVLALNSANGNQN